MPRYDPHSIEPMVKERLSRDCSRVTVGGSAPTPTQPNGTPAIQLNPNCPARGAVTADSLTNSLSITDIPANLDELESYARSIDLRQPEKLIVTPADDTGKTEKINVIL